MGQYQQWLRYQDVERSLCKTRRALEEELVHLEGQLDTMFLEQLSRPSHPLVANPILYSLATTSESLPTFPPEQPSTNHHPLAAPVQGNGVQSASNAVAEDVNALDWLHAIFSALLPEEVEQFYAAYRQWQLHMRIVELRQRLAEVEGQLGLNELRLQQCQPPPIALASLARLQSHGVDEIELLDQMLERGETWLDVTMQRLDYCEHFENFLSDDYTQWCRRALEGAFDWIDTLRIADVSTGEPSDPPAAQNEEGPAQADVEETEVMLLQKLTTEADDDENNGLAVTLKQAVETPQDGQDVEAAEEEQPSLEIDQEAAHEEQPPLEIEEATTPEEQSSLETQELAEVEEDGQEITETTDPPDNTVAASKKQSAVRRLVGKLWGA
jgi:hypothetical protein